MTMDVSPEIDAIVFMANNNDKIGIARAMQSSIIADRKALHKVICDLYDNGFNNPIITFETAVAYLDEPTFPGHPEKQRVSRKENPYGW